MIYRKATLDDLNKIWAKDILENEGDSRYVVWKEQFIQNNLAGKCVTFVCCDGDDPVGQVTLILSSSCLKIKKREQLCDGVSIANMGTFRIESKYEGQGHISKLVKMAENCAKDKGFKFLSIGSEAKESRNLAIYLHFGYTDFLFEYKEEGEPLVLYYKKAIN